MSDNKKRDAGKYRKRKKNLNKLIVINLVTVIILSCTGCIFLLDRIYSMNGRIAELNGQVGQLQEQLRQLQETIPAVGETVNTDPPKDSAAQLQEGDAEAFETEDLPEEQDLHKVYLTFDDGPSIYTADILDILEEFDVKATFFVVGMEDAESQELLKRIVQEGHTLGLHSYTHKYSQLYDSVENFSEDCIRLQEYLYQVTGVKSSFYRFPGGSSNKVSRIDMQECIDYLHSQGMEYYDWNISSGDGGSALLSTDALLENCMKNIEGKSTSMILLHDSANKKTTVEALPDIIRNILALEDTVILPITEDTEPVQHIRK